LEKLGVYPYELIDLIFPIDQVLGFPPLGQQRNPGDPKILVVEGVRIRSLRFGLRIALQDRFANVRKLNRNGERLWDPAAIMTHNQSDAFCKAEPISGRVDMVRPEKQSTRSSERGNNLPVPS
jgi:hypothetical protein